jgi:hypothetical protein
MLPLPPLDTRSNPWRSLKDNRTLPELHIGIPPRWPKISCASQHGMTHCGIRPVPNCLRRLASEPPSSGSGTGHSSEPEAPMMLERQSLDTGNPAVSFGLRLQPATSTMTSTASPWDLVSAKPSSGEKVSATSSLSRRRRLCTAARGSTAGRSSLVSTGSFRTGKMPIKSSLRRQLARMCPSWEDRHSSVAARVQANDHRASRATPQNERSPRPRSYLHPNPLP